MTRPPRLIRVLSILALLLPGCGAVSALLYKVTPEPTVPAKYTLRDVPTVVMVENYKNPDLVANDAELVARSLQDELTEHKLLKTLIKTEKILDLRNSQPKDFPKMTVPQVAKAVGAEQVVYVDLQGGGISSLTGNSMFQGRSSAYVKVIDAKTGQTQWPTDTADGYGVNYETNAIKGRAEGSYLAVRSDLYEGLARTIGRLFHPWKASEDDEDDK